MTITVDRDVDLMLVAGTGVGFGVDKGATAPAAPSNPAAVPSASWKPMGATSTDAGLEESFTSESSQVYAWGLLTPFRTIMTSQITTFKLSLLETERDICVSLFYRRALADLAKVSGIRSFSDSGTPEPDRRAFLFKVADGSVVKQFYIPVGEISDRGNVVYKSDAASIFEITVTAYPDDAGKTVYRSDNAPDTPIGSNS